jgi:hypothetical protein
VDGDLDRPGEDVAAAGGWAWKSMPQSRRSIVASGSIATRRPPYKSSTGPRCVPRAVSGRATPRNRQRALELDGAIGFEDELARFEDDLRMVARVDVSKPTRRGVARSTCRVRQTE